MSTLSETIDNLRQFTANKQYKTIYADPPWQFQNRTGKVAPEHKRLNRYSTMTLDDIKALPVNEISDDKSHLYLWVPNALLPDGLEVMKAWGFEYKTNFADIDSSKGFTGLVKGYNTSVTGFFEEAVFEPFKDKKVIAEIMAFVSCMLVALWYSFSKPAIIAGAAAGAVIVIERLFLRERIKKLPAAVRYIYLVLLSMLIFGAVYFGNVYGWRKWALGLIGVGDKYFISKELRKVILSHLFIFIAGIVYIIPSLRKFVAGRVEKFGEESARAYTFVESCKTVLKALMLVMCITGIIVGKL